MCGLVGVFNKNRSGFTKDQQDVFNTLLFIDFLRGPDSTGAFVVTNRGDVHIAKEASDSLRFVRSKEFNKLHDVAWKEGAAFIGHNRKATSGDIVDANAHPFIVEDNIILVHNGTLWGSHKKIADVEVDSHAIAHALHKEGDIEKALSTIDGAYALIWYDVAKEQINLVRNSARPLWWMETGSSWIWSSEKAMLNFAAERHSLFIKDGPHEIPADDLQTYSLKDQTWVVTNSKLKIVKEYKTYQNPTQGYSHHPYARANGYINDLVWGSDDGDFQDVPFRGGARSDPEKGYPVVVKTTPKPNGVDNITETYSTHDAPGTTGYFEREMCRKMNCIITNDQWKEETMRKYPFGSEVIAEAFEYSYANQKDPTGGYYLYCRVCDDQDIVVRLWRDSKRVTEEQMITFAGSGYVYKFKVDKKQWRAYSPGAVVGRSPGFVMILSEETTLLWGGGIGDPKYAPKKEVMH